LSGLRVGWIVERDRNLREKYLDARSYFTISGTSLGDLLAVIAMRNREKILSRVRQVASANLSLLKEFFFEHSEVLAWVPPRGGMTVFPWLKNGSDTRSFCQALAERGVLLAPGDCFGAADHFRLNFGARDVGYPEALEILADFIRQGGSRAAEV
jgi:aspartate/methionine/tyrosine aminotransferase